MPYEPITQLSDSVKNHLPKHALEIYEETFNSAEEQYGEEDRAHRVAWSAVEQEIREVRQGQLGPKGQLTRPPEIGCQNGCNRSPSHGAPVLLGALPMPVAEPMAVA